MAVSTFGLFKMGIGPSSLHTVEPHGRGLRFVGPCSAAARPTLPGSRFRRPGATSFIMLFTVLMSTIVNMSESEGLLNAAASAGKQITTRSVCEQESNSFDTRGRL